MATVIIKSSTSDNQALVDSTGHLLVTGTAGGGNASVGTTGTVAPTSATEVGGVDISGNLQPLLINSLGQLETSAVGTFTPQGLQIKGIITMVTIDNTAWYLAPPSPLLNRNNIQVQNPSTGTSDIIWNYDNTQPLTAGLHVPAGASYSVAIKGTIPVYITLAGAGTISVPVEELE